MAECCASTAACTKSRAIFTLGLLECFFFSGFLVGYGFLSQTLEVQGYFSSDDCVHRLSPSSSGSVVCSNVSAASAGTSSVTSLTTPSTARAYPTIVIANRTLTVRRVTPPGLPPSGRGGNTAKAREGTGVVAIGGSGVVGTITTHGYRLNGQRGGTDCGNIGTASYNASGDSGSTVVGEAEVNMTLNRAEALCVEGQRSTLRWVYKVALLVTGLLAAPLGLLYDIVGTLKTRVIPIVLFITTNLLITFSSKDQPWVLFVAVPAAGLSGVLLVLTNLQVANLLHHRATALLLYHMAHDAAAIVMLLVQLSAGAGLNVQSSFMFLTGGVIPLLICTIAFLPKRQIPWPLPDNYKEMKDSIRMYVHKNCQAQMRKKASHRRLLRLSVATGGLSCLYLMHITWYTAMMLRVRAVEFRDGAWCNRNQYTTSAVTTTTTLGISAHTQSNLQATFAEPRCVYSATYPCAALLILLIGLALDRSLHEQIDSDEKKQKHILWCHSVILLALTLLNVIMSGFMMMSYPWSRHAISTIHVVLRITVPGMSASFIFTVLPCRHFGQNYGMSLAVVAITQALVLYPLDVLLPGPQSELTVNIVGLVLTILCLLYPTFLILHRSPIEFTVKAKEQDIMLCPAGSMCKSDRNKGKALAQEECQNMVESVF